jgi:hypothetical protein
MAAARGGTVLTLPPKVIAGNLRTPQLRRDDFARVEAL